VTPTSNIFLNVPDPLSIKTLELSEIKRSPGDALLKDGTPVPEPNMINSDNVSPPNESWSQEKTPALRPGSRRVDIIPPI